MHGGRGRFGGIAGRPFSRDPAVRGTPLEESKKFPPRTLQQPIAAGDDDARRVRAAAELQRLEHLTPYHLQPPAEVKEIERYADKYRRRMERVQQSLSLVETDLGALPNELQTAPFADKRVRPYAPSKAKQRKQAGRALRAKLGEIGDDRDGDDDDDEGGDKKRRKRTGGEDDDDDDNDDDEAEGGEDEDEDGDYGTNYYEERDEGDEGDGGDEGGGGEPVM